MDICRLHGFVDEILGQLFCHALGESGDECAFATLGAAANLFEEVVNGEIRVAHLNLGVEQPRGANHLIDIYTAALLQFIVGGGGADIDGLRHDGSELFKFQRTIVESCGKPEAIVDEALLAAAVAAIHRPNLRHGDMALIDHEQKIFWKEVEQTVGASAGSSAIEIAAIVFDARAMPQFANHLNVVADALFQAFGLERLAHLLEECHLLHHVILNLADGPFLRFLARQEKIGRIEFVLVEGVEDMARVGIHLFDGVDFIAPEVDA